MKKTDFRFTYTEFSNTGELSAELAELVIRATEIAQKSYSPYSEFGVGAAVLLGSGEIVTGNNQENSAYPSGMCAERVALYHAVSQNPGAVIKSVAITAFRKGEMTEEPVYPCGACRQVMLEYSHRQKEPVQVIFAGKSRIQIVRDATDLLPLSFNREMLKGGR